MLRSCIVFLMFFGLATMTYGQEARATASTQIDGKPVTIEYGSPALKGRNLAEFMQKLPADRIWRAGIVGRPECDYTGLSAGEKEVLKGTQMLGNDDRGRKRRLLMLSVVFVAAGLSA